MSVKETNKQKVERVTVELNVAYEKMCNSYEHCHECPYTNAPRNTTCKTIYFVEKMAERAGMLEVDWTKVPVDTKIVAWDSDANRPVNRYFAKYEDGVIFAWANGATSYSARSVTSWSNANLFTEE